MSALRWVWKYEQCPAPLPFQIYRLPSAIITNVNQPVLIDSKLSLDGESGLSDLRTMVQQSFRLYIQRIDARKNMARFYAMSIEPTLFGDTSLVRNWGRIGTHGQQRIHLFENERQAVDLFLDLLRQKRRKGYKPASRCEHP